LRLLITCCKQLQFLHGSAAINLIALHSSFGGNVPGTHREFIMHTRHERVQLGDHRTDFRSNLHTGIGKFIQ
jgi:hypothetical protein